MKGANEYSFTPPPERSDTPFTPSPKENAMESLDTLAPLTGVPVVVIVPALVEGAKQAGLPVRFAGLAAVGCAIALLALGDLALADGTPDVGQIARWLVGGIVYGLAAAGLYSQRHVAAGTHRMRGAWTVKTRSESRIRIADSLHARGPVVRGSSDSESE